MLTINFSFLFQKIIRKFENDKIFKKKKFYLLNRILTNNILLFSNWKYYILKLLLYILRLYSPIF